MNRNLTVSGVIVIVGSYGSGKTEVAINLAAWERARGADVQLADLDLVNLYFRSRQARDTLTDQGIRMILPPKELLNADLPVLTPQISSVVKKPGDLTILDVGGDKVGARVLGALADAFHATAHPVHVWQVVNPHRPDTGTIDKCLDMCAAIEAAAGLSVTGWVGNANLMGETVADHIYGGYKMMVALARQSGRPLTLTAVPEELIGKLDPSDFDCPILPIRRQLVPPWEKARSLNG